MQKWEYLYLQFDDRKVYRINGQELKDWKKGPPWFVYINDLGEQGWEVAKLHIEGRLPLECLFKRPKP